MTTSLGSLDTQKAQEGRFHLTFVKRESVGETLMP